MDIKLKPLQKEDLELVRTWRNSEEVNKYMYSDVNLTIEDQTKWYEKVKNDTSSRYWIIEYDGIPLGLANIVNINNVFNSCDWAFYLGDSSIRGKGIGSKVEYNVISYVFEHLNLNKLNCEVFTFNDSVIKMHEKFGFRREAYYRQHCYKNGKYHDVIRLGLLKDEWNMIKNYHYERIYSR